MQPQNYSNSDYVTLQNETDVIKCYDAVDKFMAQEGGPIARYSKLGKFTVFTKKKPTEPWLTLAERKNPHG